VDLEVIRNPGSMYRIIAVQADKGAIGTVESMVSGWALDDQQAGILQALKQNMDRQLLAALGQVDPHRFWLYYEFPEGNPYMAGPGIPQHNLKAQPDEGAWILNGPEAGTWSPVFPWKAHGLRTVNGNNVETYNLAHYEEMAFAIHVGTESPRYFAPQPRRLG
jgi:hypothetical protein